MEDLVNSGIMLRGPWRSLSLDHESRHIMFPEASHETIVVADDRNYYLAYVIRHGAVDVWYPMNQAKSKIGSYTTLRDAPYIIWCKLEPHAAVPWNIKICRGCPCDEQCLECFKRKFKADFKARAMIIKAIREERKKRFGSHYADVTVEAHIAEDAEMAMAFDIAYKQVKAEVLDAVNGAFNSIEEVRYGNRKQ